MTEQEFWDLIATLGGSADEDGTAGLEDELSALDASAITAFADRFAAALVALDRPEIARQTYWELGSDTPVPPSADGFLYARAAVVAAGRATYEQVLADPTAFSREWDLDAEGLLYVASSAYEEATGQEWTHETVDVESQLHG